MSRSNQTTTELEALQADNEGDPDLTFGRGEEGRARALAYARAVRPTGYLSLVALELPNEAWELLAAEAKQRDMPLDKLVRVIIASHLYAKRP